MKITLTIDVEDYFQVSALAKAINIKGWNSIESRMIENVRFLPGLFDEHNACPGLIFCYLFFVYYNQGRINLMSWDCSALVMK